ncbi:MAG: HlyD family efflux transporter periplasmic adaptor subunit [Polyangiaceae bacterium]
MSPDPEPPKKKGPPPQLIVLLLVAVLGGGGYYGYKRWAATQPLEWSGTIEVHEISVGSRAGGRVKEVLVKEGDHVEAGQALIVLEPGDLEAQLSMAEAQLDQARAALDKLKNGARPEEIAAAKARAESAQAGLQEAQHGARYEQIVAAKARLTAAQVAVDRAKLEYDRQKKLFDANIVPQAELDAADANLKAANAQRDAAQATLTELSNGTRAEDVSQAKSRVDEAKANASLIESGARIEDIRAATSVVQAAEARVQQLKITIEELTVRATRPARVETLDLRPGDIVGPNATAAVLLEDDQLFVRIYVPETQIGFARVGAAVPIYVDSFPDKPFEGVVAHIDSQGQYSPRNLQTADERANQVFAMRVEVVGDHENLRAGMAAWIKVKR